MTAPLRLTLLPLALIAVALADLTPTAPGPGQSFNAGSNCTINWDVDSTGTWNNVTINLMSGSNTNMSLVTNVVSGLDGTDATLVPMNWTCPDVDPYAPIYFYQFSDGLGNTTWTTRFTIASSSGEHFPPENAAQPNGDPIPWGTGTLAANGTDSISTPGTVPEPADPDTPSDDLDGDSDGEPSPDPSDSSDEDPSGDDSSDDGLDGDTDADSPDQSDLGSSADDTSAPTGTLSQADISPDSPVPWILTRDDKHSGDSGDDDEGSHEKDGNGKPKNEGGDGNSGKAKGDKEGDDSDKKSSEPEKKAVSGGDKSSSSSSHKASPTAHGQDEDTAKPSGSSSSKKEPSPSSASKPAPKDTAKVSSSHKPAATEANTESAPTPALPPVPKKGRSNSTASESAASASKTTHAASPSNTCSCSPDQQQGGISKLLNGGSSEVEKVSGWIHLVVPLVIAVLVLY
ncbi:GPI anchored serine-threonine rich family protein [Phanerochaete sordida]|uniref:GPI anchored serine-threonine rich family protein n=1 Tax=Phanerochaete sordida TaxID=48140 RepID=A0A9P3G3F3_9APHY|nr:GPI anchored serine-threonine rich family protein [Phanerochaete sordida]